MRLNERLSELRKKHRLTQSELGVKLNVSAQAISKWELGSSEPDFTTLTRLAEIYKITLAELLDPGEAPQKIDVQKTNGGKWDICLKDFSCTESYATIIISRLCALESTINCYWDERPLNLLLFRGVDENVANEVVDYLNISNIIVEVTPSDKVLSPILPDTSDIKKYGNYIKTQKTANGELEEKKILEHISKDVHHGKAVMKYFHQVNKDSVLPALGIGVLFAFVMAILMAVISIFADPKPAASVWIFILLCAFAHGSFCGYATFFNTHYRTLTEKIIDLIGERLILVFFISLFASVEYLFTILIRIKRAKADDYSDIPDTDKFTIRSIDPSLKGELL